MKRAMIIIPGPPPGKPRQTRSDKWKRRPCVMRYREWADKARAAVIESLGELLSADRVDSLSWTAYFEPPKSLSAVKRAAAIGLPYRKKPDRDNIDKSVLDALFSNGDEAIAYGTLEKIYGYPARLELRIWYDGISDSVTGRN